MYDAGVGAVPGVLILDYVCSRSSCSRTSSGLPSLPIASSPAVSLWHASWVPDCLQEKSRGLAMAPTQDQDIPSKCLPSQVNEVANIPLYNIRWCRQKLKITKYKDQLILYACYCLRLLQSQRQ